VRWRSGRASRSVAVMATHFDGIESIKAKVGEHLGYSDWNEVTQDQVNLFADATGDHQWIHVDPERATKESPFGGPIAHGYLTLSLAPVLLSQVYSVSGVSMGVNYGLNKVRFPAPVPVGSRLRLGASLLSIEEIPGGAQIVMSMTFEVEGQAKPSCVAEAVYRFYV
jgi:acyl dehydratase